MRLTDIHYAAGLLEGEGCFKSRQRLDKPRSCYIAISAGMTDKEPLDRLQKILGGKVYGPYSRPCPSKKPFFVWQFCSRDEVAAITKILFPHLSPRRQKAAQKILDFHKEFPRNRKRKL